MAREWRSVRVVVTPATRQQALDLLFAAGATGVAEDDDGLLTAFPADKSLDRLRAQLAGASATMEVGDLPESDWLETWKRGITAHRVGELTVAPPWLAESLDPLTTVVIEPAMAFGTGEHPSTRGALRLLSHAVHRGDRVADLGAGSGVLAIAAAKLGAARVAAIESDPDAVGNLEENVRRNGVEGVVSALEGDAATLLPLVAPVEVVVANIITTVIMEMLAVIEQALVPHGRAIVAGILVTERDSTREMLLAHGWQVTGEEVEAQWWSARLER